MCQVEGTFARFDTHQFNMSEATGNQTTVCIVFDNQITTYKFFTNFSVKSGKNYVRFQTSFK